MSVVNVQPKWSGEVSGASTEGRRFRRILTVLMSSVSDGATLARLATGVPRVGEHLAEDGWLVCSDVNCERISPFLYELTAEYERTYAGQEGDENPLAAPAEWHWGSVASTEQIDRDINGKAIQTPVGEQFDPPVILTINDPSLTITRNELFFNPAVIIDYQDAVNSDYFLGFAPGIARVASIDGITQHQGDWNYWQVSYQILFRRDGWWKRVLCAGTRYWTGEYIPMKVGTTLYSIPQILSVTDDDGRHGSRPVPLTLSGKLLPIGHWEYATPGDPTSARIWIPPIPAASAPLWMYFPVYVWRPFAALHLT